MSEYIDTSLDGTTTSVTGGPVRLSLDTLVGFSFHQQWNHSGTADLVATTTVEASNDSRVQEDINSGVDGTGSETARWEDVTSEFSSTLTSPTSGAGGGIIKGSFGNWDWVRVKCARSSGDGGYRVWLAFAFR